MTLDETLAAIDEASVPAADGQAHIPSPAIIAFFVRWVRGLRQWKKETFASIAGVSISTVERVERAEKVSDESLDRIAIGLGYDKSYFTAPRVPLSSEATVARLEETWGHLIPVAVRPLSTEIAIRQLGQCHGILMHRPDVPETFDASIDELTEWLDLASYMIGCLAPAVTEGRRRKLYTDILDCVRRLERSGLYVLGGVMDAPQDDLPDWRLAVISITRRCDDPGAPKRREVYVDQRWGGHSVFLTPGNNI